MQVDNGADDHDVHDLVAVAPVVKQARAEALGDLDDVHQPSQYGQSVHDDEEAHGARTARPVSVNPEQEEDEAEQRLPNERSQPQDVGVGRGGTVDPIGWEDDVDQQGGALQGGVAEEGDVYDGKSPWREGEVKRFRTSRFQTWCEAV